MASSSISGGIYGRNRIEELSNMKKNG